MSNEMKDECNVGDCKSKVHEWGVCKAHFDQGYRIDTCTAPGCTEEPWAKGLCHAHLARVGRAQKRGKSAREVLKKPVRTYRDNGGQHVEKKDVFTRVELDVAAVLKSVAEERGCGVFSVAQDVITKWARRKSTSGESASA